MFNILMPPCASNQGLLAQIAVHIQDAHLYLLISLCWFVSLILKHNFIYKFFEAILLFASDKSLC